MIRCVDVAPDWSSVPANVRLVAEAAIDAMLQPVWAPTEIFRDLTVTWADYGGITQNKANGLTAVFNIYRGVGLWNVAIQSSTDQVWVVRFSRDRGI